MNFKTLIDVSSPFKLKNTINEIITAIIGINLESGEGINSIKQIYNYKPNGMPVVTGENSGAFGGFWKNYLKCDVYQKVHITLPGVGTQNFIYSYNSADSKMSCASEYASENPSTAIYLTNEDGGWKTNIVIGSFDYTIVAETTDDNELSSLKLITAIEDIFEAEIEENTPYGGKTTTNVDGTQSFSLGASNHIYGDTSVALGRDNTIYGEAAVALGGGNKIGDAINPIYGKCSIAVGDTNVILATRAFAAGTANMIDINATHAAVFGSDNVISAGAVRAFVAGFQNNAGYAGSALFGQGNTSNNANQFICGRFNKSNGSAIFMVGNGNGAAAANRKNSIEVLYGGQINLNGTTVTDGDFACKRNIIAQRQVYVTEAPTTPDAVVRKQDLEAVSLTASQKINLLALVNGLTATQIQAFNSFAKSLSA